jgi:hypothetical protein
LISYEFVDQKEVQEKFKVVNYELNDEEYERVSAFGWCRDIIQQFNEFMVEMANGKHPIPGKYRVLPKLFNKQAISRKTVKLRQTSNKL